MFDFVMVRYNHTKHLEWLFEQMSSPEEQKMFLKNNIFNSIRDFDGWIQDNLKYFFHEFFIIETVNNESVGFIYSYDSEMINLHCKLTVYIAGKYRDTGIGAYIGLEFMNYLFTNYPYRRLYCDVYDYNTQSLNSLLQCGLEEMGRIKEYRFYNGEYHDLVLLTISRYDFERKLKKIITD